MHHRSFTDPDIYKHYQAIAPNSVPRDKAASRVSDSASHHPQHPINGNLIKQATARLRQRQLEEQLSGIIHDKMRTRRHLERSRANTLATMNDIYKRKAGQNDGPDMGHRIMVRQAYLDQITQTNIENVDPIVPALPRISVSPHTSTALSALSTHTASPLRHSTGISSNECWNGVSTDASTVSSTWDQWFAETKERQRREHRHTHSHQYGNKNYEPVHTETRNLTGNRPRSSSENQQQHVALTFTDSSLCTTPLSNDTCYPEHYSNVKDGSKNRIERQKNHPYSGKLKKHKQQHPDWQGQPMQTVGHSSLQDIRRAYLAHEEAGNYRQARSLSEIIPQDHDAHSRNVLDDVLSFLDGLSENADDGGFGEDLDLLLRNPELYSQTKDALRSHNKQPTPKSSFASTLIMLWLSPWYFVLSMFSVSIRWCRFLYVICTTIAINVFNGPQAMLKWFSE